MDFEEIARQGREMEQANRETQERTAGNLAERWGVEKELAEYILSLERRIQDLESR